MRIRVLLFLPRSHGGGRQKNHRFVNSGLRSPLFGSQEPGNSNLQAGGFVQALQDAIQAAADLKARYDCARESSRAENS